MDNKLIAIQKATRKLSDTLGRALEQLKEVKPSMFVLVYQDPATEMYITWADGHKNRNDVAHQLGMLDIAKYQIMHEEDYDY